MSPFKVAQLLGVMIIAASADASAQTVTAFKSGEQTTGMTKQCYYNALGSTHSITINSTQLCPLSIQVQSPPRRQRADSTLPPPRPRTVTAFKTGERTTGMTKQCFYDALGSEYTRTIGSTELCPLSIQVRTPGS